MPGVFSHVWCGSLKKHYERARQQSPNLTDETALVTGRIVNQLEQIARRHTPAWQRLCALAGELRAATVDLAEARRVSNDIEMESAVKQIEALTTELTKLGENGMADETAWRRIFFGINAKRRLVVAEVRRQKTANESLSRDQAFALVGAIAALINLHVRDVAAKRAILEDVPRLMGGSPP